MEAYQEQIAKAEAYAKALGYPKFGEWHELGLNSVVASFGHTVPTIMIECGTTWMVIFERKEFIR